jgi:hypothetical protein
MKSDCWIVWWAFEGICNSYFDGNTGSNCTRVYRQISSLEMTESGSYREILASLNLAFMFFFVKTLLWAALNVMKNLDLVIWLIEA